MKMPVRYLRAYLSQLERTEAERDMRLAVAVGAGSGTLKDADKVWGRWRESAGITKEKTVRKVSARDAARLLAGVTNG